MKSTISLLDPMRAFAAWAVIAWHLSPHVGYTMPLFASAAFAVDGFMNISGFLMMYHYVIRRPVEPWESPRTWGRFLVRRFFRIAPLYYLLLVLAWQLNLVPALQSSPAGAGGEESGPPSPSVLKFFLMHFSFLFGLFPSFASDNIIPDWSLSLEMQFYAVFPFLALLIKRFGTPVFFFVCCLIGAVANALISYYPGTPPGLLGWFPQPSFLPLKLHVFAVGIVAAKVYFNGPRELRSVWYIPAFFLFSLTCIYNYTKLLGAIYWLLYLGALIPASARLLRPALTRINNWCEVKGWFRWPAELSYSGYLMHGIVFALIFRWWSRHHAEPSMSSGAFALTCALMILLISALGVLFHFSVERPGIRLGKALLGRSPAGRK